MALNPSSQSSTSVRSPKFNNFIPVLLPLLPLITVTPFLKSSPQRNIVCDEPSVKSHMINLTTSTMTLSTSARCVKRQTLFGGDDLTPSSSSSKSLLGLAVHRITRMSISTLQVQQDVALPALSSKVDLGQGFVVNASGVDVRDDLHVLSVGPVHALP